MSKWVEDLEKLSIIIDGKAPNSADMIALALISSIQEKTGTNDFLDSQYIKYLERIKNG